MRFDLVVLGDTPDAWTAAEDVALLGGSVAVLRPELERTDAALGVAAVLAAYGDGASVVARPRTASPRDLWYDAIRRHEWSVQRLVQTFGVLSCRGRVQLTGRDSAEFFDNEEIRSVRGDLLLIAVGTTGRRSRGLPFDRRTFLLPEDVPHIASAPRSVVVLGGNRTARAFARLFSAAGSNVRIVDSGTDDSSEPSFTRLAGDVLDLRRESSGIRLRLMNDRIFTADTVLFAADRAGATGRLNLAAAELDADEDGRLWCDDEGRTWVPTIRAAGEVVGYPRRLREDGMSARKMFAGRRFHHAEPSRAS